MRNVTIRMPEDMVDRLDEDVDRLDLDGRADLARDLIRLGWQAERLQDERDELAAERDRIQSELGDEYIPRAKHSKAIAELEQEIERLTRERRQLLEQREENQELVRFAEEQRSVVREQREEERRRRSANMFRRAWWFVAGEPDPEAVNS